MFQHQSWGLSCGGIYRFGGRRVRGSGSELHVLPMASHSRLTISRSFIALGTYDAKSISGPRPHSGHGLRTLSLRERARALLGSDRQRFLPSDRSDLQHGLRADPESGAWDECRSLWRSHITSTAQSGPYPASPDGAILHWVHMNPQSKGHPPGLLDSSRPISSVKTRLTPVRGGTRTVDHPPGVAIDRRADPRLADSLRGETVISFDTEFIREARFTRSSRSFRSRPRRIRGSWTRGRSRKITAPVPRAVLTRGSSRCSVYSGTSPSQDRARDPR